MEKLIILGASDLGQLIAHHVVNQKSHEFIGFLDDTYEAGSKTKNGDVLGSLSEFESLSKGKVFDSFIIGIGYKHFDFRQMLYTTCKSLSKPASFIHSSVSYDSSSQIDLGTTILPGCTLDRGVIIGENCLLNTGCVIAHDSIIQDNCFLGPGVTLAGFVTVGMGSFLGVGTTVIDNISLSEGTQTGGGAVVTRCTESSGLYVGVPAKKIR